MQVNLLCDGITEYVAAARSKHLTYRLMAVNVNPVYVVVATQLSYLAGELN